MPPPNTSYQGSAANATKAAKFINANPLAPIADPFSGDVADDGAAAARTELANNINTRMEAAVGDIREKYEAGRGGRDDDVDRAPTGTSYREQQAERVAAREKIETEEEEGRRARAEAAGAVAVARDAALAHLRDGDADEDSEDEYDRLLDDLEDDPAVQVMRQKRLEELQKDQAVRAENLARGHGQYRTISQDEFLKECIASTYVACHFFSGDFKRCEIMDHHLQMIARQHIECKFIRIDASKTPFFVSKLAIQTLPTLLVFKGGKVVSTLTGFEGLAQNPADPDRWHTGRLQQWLAETGAVDYTVPDEEVKEEMERMGIRVHGSIYGSELGGYDSDGD